MVAEYGDKSRNAGQGFVLSDWTAVELSTAVTLAVHFLGLYTRCYRFSFPDSRNPAKPNGFHTVSLNRAQLPSFADGAAMPVATLHTTPVWEPHEGSLLCSCGLCSTICAQTLPISSRWSQTRWRMGLRCRRALRCWRAAPCLVRSRRWLRGVVGLGRAQCAYALCVRACGCCWPSRCGDAGGHFSYWCGLLTCSTG